MQDNKYIIRTKKAVENTFSDAERYCMYVTKESLQNYLFYSSTSITWGDGRDPQYVEDGAKCAEDKVRFPSF